MGRFGTKKCALLQCVFWRSRLTHAHHLWRKRVRRRYYRFVNRHIERGGADRPREGSWSRARCYKNPSLGPDIGVAGWRSRRRQASPAPRASLLATAPLALIALSEFVYTSTNLYSGMRQRLRQASRGVSNPYPAPKCVMQLLLARVYELNRNQMRVVSELHVQFLTRLVLYIRHSYISSLVCH